jgi:hypothetical protein
MRSGTGRTKPVPALTVKASGIPVQVPSRRCRCGSRGCDMARGSKRLRAASTIWRRRAGRRDTSATSPHGRIEPRAWQAGRRPTAGEPLRVPGALADSPAHYSPRKRPCWWLARRPVECRRLQAPLRRRRGGGLGIHRAVRPSGALAGPRSAVPALPPSSVADGTTWSRAALEHGVTLCAGGSPGSPSRRGGVGAKETTGIRSVLRCASQNAVPQRSMHQT